MAGNELIAGIAGLAEGIGGYFSERHRLRLEKEEKKEREQAKEAASVQQGIENKLRQGQLDAENKRIDATASAAESRVKLQRLTLEYRMKRDSAKDDIEKKKIDLQYADKFAALGENVFEVASYIDSYNPSGQQAPTMPGAAPGGPAQPGNPPAGTNTQAPQFSNQQAPVMSTIGSGRIPSPVQTPQLQMGQPAGAPPQQGQPAAPGQPGPQQGMVPGAPQQLRPGIRTADTRAGAGIGLNQAQTKAALAGIQEKDAQTEHIQAETAMLGLQAKIRSMEVPKQLAEMDKKLRKMDDDHVLAKEEEKVKAASYDNLVAIAHIHAAQAQVESNLQKYKLLGEQREASIKGLEIEIKKGQLSGFTPQSADKGTKEAEDASKEKVSLSKDIASTKVAIAFSEGLVERNGEPFPGKDAKASALNNMMKGAFVNYGANLKLLKVLQDQYVAANYRETEGNYAKAMGTKVLDTSGKVDQRATQDAQSNARSRYLIAKKDYDELQKSREEQMHPELKKSSPLPVVLPPGFTTEKKHFTNGNTNHGAKKQGTGSKKSASDPLGILQ